MANNKYNTETEIEPPAPIGIKCMPLCENHQASAAVYRLSVAAKLKVPHLSKAVVRSAFERLN